MGAPVRRLAIVSLLYVAGCASAPPRAPLDRTVAAHPPATIPRLWLIPTPNDEITLFDTRTLRALREVDETEALNASGSGRVQQPGFWVAIGVLGAAAVAASGDSSDDGGCTLGTNCH